MNTACVSGCLDVETPIRVSFTKLYQWPESDAEFVRLISMKDRSITTSGELPRRSHEGYASRQTYLRSYAFSKRETIAERARKWFAEKMRKKKKVGGRSTMKAVKDKSVSTVCHVFDAVFVCLLSCMTGVDVVECN